MENVMRDPSRTMLNKVPLVTLYFWVIKIMATTVGETAADFLNTKLNLGLTHTSLVMGALLIAALVIQFRKDRYVPWIYWVAVVLISVVGTLITDNLSDNFGVPLPLSATGFAIALAATFFIWYAIEKTLSIHTIFTMRRELFYWAAILFTFALGTAAGDLLAEQLKLGYLYSAMVFGAGIALTYAAYRIFNLNAVAAFWIAYILTRPFGASLGDLLSQPSSNGGLGLDTVGTSALFLTVILGLIIAMTKAQRRTSHPLGVAASEK
jgi:uncharacterized membrane-anchored protein